MPPNRLKPEESSDLSDWPRSAPAAAAVVEREVEEREGEQGQTEV